MKKEIDVCDICGVGIAKGKCEICGKDFCDNCGKDWGVRLSYNGGFVIAVNF